MIYFISDFLKSINKKQPMVDLMIVFSKYSLILSKCRCNINIIVQACRIVLLFQVLWICHFEFVNTSLSDLQPSKNESTKCLVNPGKHEPVLLYYEKSNMTHCKHNENQNSKEIETKLLFNHCISNFENELRLKIIQSLYRMFKNEFSKLLVNNEISLFFNSYNSENRKKIYENVKNFIKEQILKFDDFKSVSEYKTLLNIKPSTTTHSVINDDSSALISDIVLENFELLSFRKAAHVELPDGSRCIYNTALNQYIIECPRCKKIKKGPFYFCGSSCTHLNNTKNELFSVRKKEEIKIITLKRNVKNQ